MCYRDTEIGLLPKSTKWSVGDKSRDAAAEKQPAHRGLTPSSNYIQQMQAYSTLILLLQKGSIKSKPL